MLESIGASFDGVVFCNPTLSEVPPFLNFADNSLHHHFFRNQTEFEIKGVFFEQCLNCESKEKMIKSVQLRFHRIFKGRIVRFDGSYIKVTMTPDNQIISVKIKWPYYEEMIATQDPNYFIPLLKAQDAFTSIPLKYSCNGSTEKPVKATLRGIAKTWISYTMDNRTIITPGFAYYAEVEYEDEMSKLKIVDIPTMEYYISSIPNQ